MHQAQLKSSLSINCFVQYLHDFSQEHNYYHFTISLLMLETIPIVGQISDKLSWP